MSTNRTRQRSLKDEEKKMVLWTNIRLMFYLSAVSLIGTLGNGIILFAYGNRWNSSKSTSVIFILILACVDLWTCSIVVPTIVLMEYRDFEVPTLLCRFYSFSKILIIVSSLIMSFIALDRFLNITFPHRRFLNPRRIKFLLTLCILIGIALGILTALAFSSLPYKDLYVANYSLVFDDDFSTIRHECREIFLVHHEKNNASLNDFIQSISSQLSIPFAANMSNITLSYKSTHNRCFADTSIISEAMREILRHISNKVFFVSIGIVTILYTGTFLLALHRQNPRIRALKRSLRVINEFDSNCQRTSTKIVKANESRLSLSEPTSDDFHSTTTKFPPLKQVSFQLENPEDDRRNPKENFVFISSTSFGENERVVRLPCPLFRRRQVLIQFHFFPRRCFRRLSSNDRKTSIRFSTEDETSKISINSEVLKKQLHRQRCKQIRMALTFLLITVSFVLFYLPSILYAEQYIKSPLLIYYMYLCTHAFNPIIYCFMNINLRTYVFSMLKCRRRNNFPVHRTSPGGFSTILDR